MTGFVFPVTGKSFSDTGNGTADVWCGLAEIGSGVPDVWNGFPEVCREFPDVWFGLTVTGKDFCVHGFGFSDIGFGFSTWVQEANSTTKAVQLSLPDSATARSTILKALGRSLGTLRYSSMRVSQRPSLTPSVQSKKRSPG